MRFSRSAKSGKAGSMAKQLAAWTGQSWTLELPRLRSFCCPRHSLQHPRGTLMSSIGRPGGWTKLKLFERSWHVGSSSDPGANQTRSVEVAPAEPDYLDLQGWQCSTYLMACIRPRVMLKTVPQRPVPFHLLESCCLRVVKRQAAKTIVGSISQDVLFDPASSIQLRVSQLASAICIEIVGGVGCIERPIVSFIDRPLITILTKESTLTKDGNEGWTIIRRGCLTVHAKLEETTTATFLQKCCLQHMRISEYYESRLDLRLSGKLRWRLTARQARPLLHDRI